MASRWGCFCWAAYLVVFLFLLRLTSVTSLSALVRNLAEAGEVEVAVTVAGKANLGGILGHLGAILGNLGSILAHPGTI